MFVDGSLKSTAEIFASKNITALDIHLREGLALMNGTSAMTGIGMVNVLHAHYLVGCSVVLSAITNELMKSFDDHFSFELNHVKHHPGQSRIAEAMRHILADSKLIRKRPDHLYHRKIEQAMFTDKVQEYYSLRCVPQILGPVYDTVIDVQHVLENEVNSVNDNPVIDHERENVYHGGNFHGDYVALAMDKLKIVITKLSMLSERQLNYLLNDKLNQKVISFYQPRKSRSQFRTAGNAVHCNVDNRREPTLSFPMYLHRFPQQR